MSDDWQHCRVNDERYLKLDKWGVLGATRLPEEDVR